MNDKSKKTGKGKPTGKPAVSQRATDTKRTVADNTRQTVDNAKRTVTDTKRSTTSASSGQSNKPAASAASRTAAERDRSTAQRATASTSGGGTNNTQRTVVREEKSSGGWLAPVALLFGLVGTLLSGFLWSKLNSFSSSTTTALTAQKEETQSLVADTKTELTAALDEKSTALTTALDEKSTAMDGQISGVNENMASLDKRVGEQLNTMGEQITTESQNNKEEIALSTAETMQDFTSKSETELNTMSTSFNVGIRTLREDMEGRFAENNEKVGMMQETLQSTNELANRGQRDWILAEVEYLLRTGHHRVKLAGDVKAGVLALESANDRLHALGDIDYFPVREQIKKEVTELRRLGPPNIEGLIFRLETASKVADTLPLKAKDGDAGGDGEDGEKESGGVGGLLKNMKFSVSSTNQAALDAKNNRSKASGNSPPNKEQISASEALSTHLQAARLSALRADSERFVYHMDNSLSYTGEVFDGEDDSVKAFVTDLENIRETNIVPNVPILGSALSMFEKIDASRSQK